jgi:hypothetical protein
MHPDLLHALAKERRAELLRPYEFRQPEVGLSPGPVNGPDTGIGRIRRVIGVALVGAGRRVLGDSPPNVIDLLDGWR